MGQPKLSHLILKRIFLECSFLLSFNGTLWDSKKSGKNLPMAHITEIEIGEVALVWKLMDSSLWQNPFYIFHH